MATNLAIDVKLLGEALKIGGHRTKKATVTEALHEYIRRRKQMEIVELFGSIDFDEGTATSAQYEAFMKLAGPYWMSCVTKNQAVPILAPNHYRTYLERRA